MEPIPLCGHILLTEPLPDPLDERIAFGTLSDTPDGFARLRAACTLPAGVTVCCPASEEEEPEDFGTERYIALCKQVFRPRLQERAAFYYLHDAPDFRSLRAAVIAMTDICGRSLVAELRVDEEGRMHDGTDIVAAAGVLQRIGVGAVILRADCPEDLVEALERVAPYARLSLGVRIPTAWIKSGVELMNVEYFVPLPEESSTVLAQALEGYTGVVCSARDHDDVLLAPDGRDAHFINATTDVSDEIVCDYDLGERLVEIEDEEAAAFKLVILEEEDLIHLEEHLYMLTRPVCLCAPTPELLEKALRIYHGLAIHDGTWEQTPEMLQYFQQKYGLICL